MSDGVSFFSFKNSLIFARFQFPFLQGNYWRWRVGREIFPMIYFQSLSPWKTDSGRLKQGIEIKRKYENYKIRWRLCQLLMHLKMEKIDASLSEKWFKSLCAGSSLVLSKRFSYQNNWRALYFCDTPVCFGQDVSLTYCPLSMYYQKRIVTCQDIFSSLWTQKSKVQYLVADSE